MSYSGNYSINTKPEHLVKPTVRFNASLIQKLSLIQKDSLDFQTYVESQLLDNPLVNYQRIDFSLSSMDIENFRDLPSLREQIIKQCDQSICQDIDLLISNCDKNGYLKFSVDQIASNAKTDSKRLETTRQHLLRLYPKGIGALNLRECLAVQLEDHTNDPMWISLVANDLALLAERSFERIQRKYNIPENECLSLLETIKTLNPYPASEYATESNRVARADFKIDVEEDNITITKIDHFKIEIASFKQMDGLMNQYKRYAMRVIDQINEWYDFQYKVLNQLASLQHDFLCYGQPRRICRLKDLADLCNCSISTVSRMCSTKYFLMNDQSYPFSYLLNKSVCGISKQELTDHITEIVNNENKQYPLSDFQMQYILNEKGISISRREIAKIRKSLRIPSSYERAKR